MKKTDKILTKLGVCRNKRLQQIDLIDLEVLRKLYNKIEDIEISRLTMALLLLHVQSFRDRDDIDMLVRSKYNEIQEILEWLNESTGI